MTSTSISIDYDGSSRATSSQMVENLCGPLRAGAAQSVLGIDAAGHVVVGNSTREPLLLLTLASSLGSESLRVQVTLDPAGTARSLPALEFSPFTQAGAALAIDPLPRRGAGLGADARVSPPFTISLGATRVDASGAATAVTVAGLAVLLQTSLLEGVLGRTLYILGAEKDRLRREARELAAMRRTASARGDALDRIGADLGVPRLADQIRYDAAKGQVVSEVVKDTSGADRAETDSEYRRRLDVYRPILLPGRNRMVAILNGPGAGADPNRGLLGGVGVSARVSIQEADNDFGIAVLLLSTIGDAYKENFLDYVRKAHMVWPLDDPATTAMLAKRFVPSAQRAREDALRASLRKSFQFPVGSAMAPMLATALDRAGKVRLALAPGSAPWKVVQTQLSGGGSRYELGLGAAVAPLAPQELDPMAANLKAGTFAPGTDAETLVLLKSMTAASSTVDPDGRWLLAPCGLRTTHRIDANQLYLSHLPVFGMVIEAAASQTILGRLQSRTLGVRYEAPSEPGSNLVLAAGLKAAASQWTTGGGAPWALLSPADSLTSWNAAGPRPPGDKALNVFGAAGLPAVAAPASPVAQLKQVSPELLATLKLPPAMAQVILAGQPAASVDLSKLVTILRSQGFSSVLPLVSGTSDVILVVAVIGLPVAGLNLSEQRATGFRWYCLPIAGSGGTIRAVGSRNIFVPGGPGLTAVVAVGYVRSGKTDPYECGIAFPEGTLLSLTQYEYVMNLLEHSCPLGVEINTFALREQHVDLDGDGKADPLPPSISRSYRQFRHRRLRGEVGVIPAPADGP
jgi:hypothetical protein